MGSRFSASTPPASADAETSTSSAARVITVSGVVKEYAAAPLPASMVLADCEPPPEVADCSCSSSSSYFLCNADSLSFDASVPALSPDEHVLPGRLYFVLPDGMQRRVLSGAEMGELAVRASKALEAAAVGKGGRMGERRKKKKDRTVKVSPVVDFIVGKEGAFEGDGCGSDRQRTAAVVSLATRVSPVQLKKSAAGSTGAAQQRRGPGAGASRRFGRRGGSFRGKLGTIEEEAAE